VNLRWGSFSKAGLIVGLLTPLMVVGAAALTGGHIFSPGPLSTVSSGSLTGSAATGAGNPQNATLLASLSGSQPVRHADLACGDCHAPFWGAETMADRCLACHTDVQLELSNPSSLHGRLPGAEACRDCHTEHHGASASLTEVDESTFPHFAFGFALDAHIKLRNGSPFVCESCHEQDLAHFQDQTCSQCHLIMDGTAFATHEITFGSSCINCHDGLDSYGSDFDHAQSGFALVAGHASVECRDCHMGSRTLDDLKATQTQCVACHRQDDPHKGKLGDDCAACHSPAQWSDVAFDHSMVGFRLTGAHEDVECAACHIDGTGSPVPTTCAGCHANDDAHDGRLGQECEACHATSAWADVHFDHRQTGFTLTGAHLEVECSACHVNGETAPVPNTCAGCHQKDDAHQGRLGNDCAACHVTSSWSKVDLGAFDHSLTGFKLMGSHQSLTCQACHTNGRWSGLGQTCAACHRADDAHNGQFGTDCSLCHTPTRWTDASFDHTTVTGFALQGSHSSLSCGSCHTAGTFSGLSQSCASCHRGDDVHNGQFGTDCGLCHTPTRWSDASFDHGKATGFALLGSHSGLACATCHTGGRFSGLSRSCVSCHRGDDAHGGQFGTDCSLCHTPTRWSDASFDHGKVTGFELLGSHSGLSCNSCHTNGQYSGLSQTCVSCHSGDDAHNGSFGTNCGGCHTPTRWSDATFDHSQTGFKLSGAHTSLSCDSCHTGGTFSGTPTACVACHSEPGYHQGLFGTDCAKCHTTSAWRPASFDQSHSFSLKHGGANGNCQTCHPSELTSYTCYKCHDQSETEKHHAEKGITDLSNCVACHPSGRD
jgi:hypothetical protein